MVEKPELTSGLPNVLKKRPIKGFVAKNEEEVKLPD